MFVGELLPLAFRVTAPGGTATDAGTVTLTLEWPDGTVTTPAVNHPGVGDYTASVVASQPGRFTMRWAATNPAAALSDVVNVAPASTVAIIGLAEAKRAANLDPNSSANDVELWPMIGAASRVVERHKGIVVARREIVARVTANRLGVLLRSIPVLSLTSVVAADGRDTWQVADLAVDSTTGRVTAPAGQPLFGDLVFTYQAGFRVVPENYIEATKIIVAHMWKTQRRPTNTRPQQSTEDDYMSGLGYSIPNRALELLGSPLAATA